MQENKALTQFLPSERSEQKSDMYMLQRENKACCLWQPWPKLPPQQQPWEAEHYETSRKTSVFVQYHMGLGETEWNTYAKSSGAEGCDSSKNENGELHRDYRSDVLVNSSWGRLLGTRKGNILQ